MGGGLTVPWNGYAARGSPIFDMQGGTRITLIGPIVRQLRLERKLSQEALASNAHVSSGYLSKLERGVYKAPSGEVLSRIAGALSIPPVALIPAPQASTT